MTEKEAHDAAIATFGSRAMISSSRTLMLSKGEPVALMSYEVGVVGDQWSWTVLGRGSSWSEALEQAKHPNARTRPAFKGPAKGGLDI